MQILQFIENLRTAFGTACAFVFSLFGETLFLVVLICLLYWLYQKKFGEKLILTSFSSMTLNSFLKLAIARPRPYTTGKVSRLELDAGPLFSTTDLAALESCPSGHSQMGAGMFFTAAFHFKKRWAWVVFPLATLGVMWSRLYFGVHYPTDVLFGAALGALFACLWEFIYQKHEKQKWYIFAGFALLSIIFTCIFPTSKSMVEICACTTAAAICLPIENKYICFEDAKGAKNRILRALIGLGCVGAVYCLFSFLPLAFLELLPWKFVKYFLTVSVATLLVPFLFKKLKL